MNIHSYQPFGFNRLPTCWPIPISDTSELNWQPNLSCLLSMHNTLPCFLNAFTLSFFAKNSLIKTGISKCMLDAYECMNKLGGDSQVVWCLISVENGGIISAINSHPTPPFPTKHQKCRNVRGDWWRFRNHVLFALFDRSRSVEWREQSPLEADLVRPGEGKSKGTLP